MVLAGPPSDKRPALALDWVSSAIFKSHFKGERERKEKSPDAFSKQGCQLRKGRGLQRLLVGLSQHKNCLKSVINTGRVIVSQAEVLHPLKHCIGASRAIGALCYRVGHGPDCEDIGRGSGL